MLHSMTGFGRAVVEEGGQRVSVEIRSVNHRFLDLAFRNPRDLQPLEGRFKEIIQSKIERGRVSVAVSWDGTGESPSSVTLDEHLAESYISALRSLQERFGLEGSVDLRTLAVVSELFRFERPECDLENVRPMVERAITKALDDLVEMKAAEGEALTRDLGARIRGLREHLERINARMPERSEEAAEALRSRVERLLGDCEVSEERVAAEIAVMAERLDCTEECVRFGIHIDQFANYLAEGGALGRRLNFLLQEMGREANTMAAKANDPVVSQAVVLVKEELEKMREQVQNVE